MKLDKMVLANAFALATAVLWVICSLVLAVFPGLYWTMSNWWLHGLLAGLVTSWRLTLNNFIFGGLSITASAWVCGYVFGWAWEKASAKK